MLNPHVKSYLSQLDRDSRSWEEYHCEHLIAEEIKDILNADSDYEKTEQDEAEQTAFDFMEDYSQDSGWGTYHGPMFALQNEQGEMVEYPSIGRIQPKTLEYWRVRAEECQNPILKYRYGNLVIDFAQQIDRSAFSIDIIRLVIDSGIEICNQVLVASLDCKTKIKRSLDLAIMVNDATRLGLVKHSILALENRIKVDDKPGLWGFAFRWLMLEYRGKVSLTQAETAALVQNLEDILKRVKSDPWLAESAVSLLAEHYSTEKDEENLIRVLGILEETLTSDDRSQSDALLLLNAYESIHEIYQKYASRFSSVRDAEKRIAKEIGALELDWNKSLKEVSVEANIPKEAIDGYLENIFGSTEPHWLDKVLVLIASLNLPRKDHLEAQLKEVAHNHPIQFLASTQIISSDGIEVAKLSSLEDDYENNLKHFASQHLQFSSLFLDISMDELKKRFKKEEFITHLSKAALFNNENQDYLRRAIEAFWEEDYLVASHLLVPLIESATRELVKVSGGVVLKPSMKSGGYDRVLLSGLLQNEEIFEKVFSQSGENVLFYFRLVLNERLGLNLRNDFAHGFGKGKFFGRQASNRLFHVFIWLTLVRKNS